jgi:hypothetical protein
MPRFNVSVLLSLLFILLPSLTFAQCPEKVVAEERELDNSGLKEVYVYDSFDTGIDISDFEINIFNELTGNYIIIESSNFPSVGINNDIEINKEGNRIQILNAPVEINLLNCVVIFIGDECPVKKIEIISR